MKIRSAVQKGLRRFVEHDDSSALPPACVEKLRRMISFLQDMSDEKELRAFSNWKAHQLTGRRRGTWSLFVTKNWRLTFIIDSVALEIVDLDFEDYH